MQNVEIKCRLADLGRAETLARRKAQARFAGEFVQIDSYFNVPRGRLKLREIRQGEATEHELIFYERPDQQLPKISSYERLPLQDGTRALRWLSRVFGLRVRVHKTRRVYLCDNVRIHFDSVRSLGHYLELEAVVSRARPRRRCLDQVRQLMQLLEIKSIDLVRSSYSDLLIRKSRTGKPAGKR